MRLSGATHVEVQDRRWRPALMAFFMRRVRNRAEAEDLTQEVFARVMTQAAGQPGHSPPDGYIFQIAANLLRDKSRRERVRHGHAMATGAMEWRGVEMIDPYRIVADREALEVLSRSLAELPERTRIIFTLYRLEHVDKAAIAKSLGISKSAVTQHVMKAMAFLIARMESTR